MPSSSSASATRALVVVGIGAFLAATGSTALVLAAMSSSSALHPARLHPGALTLAASGAALTAEQVQTTAGRATATAGVARAAPSSAAATSSAVATSSAAGTNDAAPKLTIQQLTAEHRKHGYDECKPFDFVGLGPYSRMRPSHPGRIAIPQKGGYTADHGFDVLIHFHGGDPMRRFLVQVARGVSFVSIDLGVGSSVYSGAFAKWDSFEGLQRSIVKALKQQTGFEDAHIRKLGVSSWSAGYGAVLALLYNYADKIDAVVMLDGPHAGFKPEATKQDTVAAVKGDVIAPITAYARRAMNGEKLMVVTHSKIVPIGYASVELSVEHMLGELGVKRQPVPDDGSGALRKLSTVDVKGLHVWGYGGDDALAHCSHLAHIAEIVRDLVEPYWGTPAMDRDVPFTAAPVLGDGSGPQNAGSTLGSGSIELEPVQPSNAAAPAADPAPPAEAAPPADG